MSDDVSKLPALPDACKAPRFEDEAWRYYYQDMADAYQARMEALVEYAQHDVDCEKWVPDYEGDRWLSDTRKCSCGLDALLAACERRTDA